MATTLKLHPPFDFTVTSIEILGLGMWKLAKRRQKWTYKSFIKHVSMLANTNTETVFEI
jgi:hypothetical protein